MAFPFLLRYILYIYIMNDRKAFQQKMPWGIYNRLKAAADKNGRSVNEEINNRINYTLERDLEKRDKHEIVQKIKDVVNDA